MELQQEIAFDLAEEMIGREVLVMIEGKVADENAYVGRTYTVSYTHLDVYKRQDIRRRRTSVWN